MSITSRPATAIIIALAAFLTATLALACSSATPRAGDVNTDRAALAALYNATNGSGWQYDTNWLSNQPLGEWEGVSTDADGRVTDLRLGDNQLSGSIPSELGNLANLEWLYLRDNQFSGCVPVKLLDTGCVAIPFVDLHPQTIAATLAVRSIPEGVTQALLLHEGIHDRFLSRVLELTSQIDVGHPADQFTDMGPLISSSQEKIVLDYIKLGQDAGFELVTGGEKLTGGEYDHGYYVEPTIFDRVDNSSSLSKEEIFGPGGYCNYLSGRG